MISKSKLNRIKPWFSWGVVLVIALFFGRTLYKNWNNLNGIDVRPDLWIVLAVIAFILSVIATGTLWGLILSKMLSKKISQREATTIQLASWLLKYVPGQAGSFLNKLAWGKRREIDGKAIAASFVYENAFMLLASVLFGMPILLIAATSKFYEGISLFTPIIILVPIIIISMTPKVFSFLLNLLFKLLKRKKLPRSYVLSAKDNLKFLLSFTIPRIINGMGFVFIAISVFSIQPSQYIVFGAIYVIAGIVGLVAVFVPSGLGVREAVITLFASIYIPAEQAIALAILTRFYATVADGLMAVLYLYLRRSIK